MINQNKIDKAAKEYQEYKVECYTDQYPDISEHIQAVEFECPLAFKKGVEFAEKELSNIAIEFANWILTQKLIILESKKSGRFFSSNKVGQNPIKIDKLFKQFVKEKYGTKEG